MKRLSMISLLVIVLSSTTAWGQTRVQQKKPEPPQELVTVLATPKQKLAMKTLLEVLPGTSDSPQQLKGAIDVIIKTNHTRFTAVPEKVWEDLTVQLVQEFGMDDLVEHFAPVYLSRLTDQEIKDLTAFYSSPLGKKWTRLQPELEKASDNIAHAVVYLINERLNEKLKALGYATPAKP